MFLGVALACAAFSFAGQGRTLASALAVVAGLIVVLLGRRLLLASSTMHAA
jgi:uncharacterized membrane protein YjjP (DUF1212 family)